MACEIIAQDLSCPTIYQAVVRKIQQDLAANLPWLDKVYPLVDVGIRKDGDRDHRYPRLLDSNSEYQDLFPNEKSGASYCFFELAGSPQQNLRENTVRFSLRLIFWVDFGTECARTDATHNLVQQVMYLNEKLFNDFVTDANFELEKDRVWSKYSYNYSHLKYVELPKTTFAVTLSVFTENDISCFDCAGDVPPGIAVEPVGDNSKIKNQTELQVDADFNIDGNGSVGTLTIKDIQSAEDDEELSALYINEDGEVESVQTVFADYDSMIDDAVKIKGVSLYVEDEDAFYYWTGSIFKEISVDLTGYVPNSRELTINGISQDLSANRSWSVGTVTSVAFGLALSLASIFSVAGSPITTAGQIDLDFQAQAANMVLAGPLNGVASKPTFRGLGLDDVSSIAINNQNAVVQTGTFRINGPGELSNVITGGVDSYLTGGPDTLNLGTSNADVINIGWSGATVNIYGTTVFNYETNLAVADKLVRFNVGGGVNTGFSSGFEIEEAGVATGYFATNATRNGWDFKAPGSFQWTLLNSSLTANRTVATPNLSGTMMLTDAGQTVTSATWNGTVIGVQYGGTGANLSATGGANQFVRQSTAGGAFTVSAITAADLTNAAITNQITAAQATSNWWISGRNISGNGTDDTTSISQLFASYTFSGGTNVRSIIRLAPTLNTTGGTNTLRGIYYNPTVTAVAVGTSHIAFENTTGNVLLGSTSGRTLIGPTVTDDLTRELQVKTSMRVMNIVFIPTAGSGSAFGASDYMQFTNTTAGTVNMALSLYPNNNAATSASEFLMYNSASGTAGSIFMGVNKTRGLIAVSNGLPLDIQMQAISFGGGWASSPAPQFRFTTTGDMGIGLTTITAYLHIKAGTAAAGDAPLKFTTGVNLTTPEIGAMEYNNTPHFTNSDATRRHLVQAPNNTKVAGVVINDGYVTLNIGGTDIKFMTTA